MNKPLIALLGGLVLALTSLFYAVSAAEPAAAKAGIPVTVAVAASKTLEEWQVSQGTLLSKSSPTIAAEVGGRVESVAVDVGQSVQAGQLLAVIDAVDFRLAKALATADIDRLQALIEARQLQVKRLDKLVRQKSVNQSSLDDARAQLGALKAQLAGAKIRRQQANRNILKTRIVSPVDGRVQARMVAVGDYLKSGTPVFQITTLETLRVRLPFPEALASRFHIGQTVRLTSPVMPGVRVEHPVTAISPAISPSNLAVDVFVDIKNPGGWEPGASVSGTVKVGEHKNAIVVPEGCVIRRPSGQVVYRIERERAVEIPVTTGLYDHGEVEILSGVAVGDRLALDGAAYLTDGVRVGIKTTARGDTP